MANPIVKGPSVWVGFNTASNNPILSTKEDAEGGIAPPPPVVTYIITEAGDFIITESGNYLITET